MLAWALAVCVHQKPNTPSQFMEKEERWKEKGKEGALLLIKAVMQLL